MNVDAGEGMGVFRHHPGQHGNLQKIQLMGDAENADGLKGRVGQHDLLRAGGSGVTLIAGLNVGFQRLPDGRQFGKQGVRHVLIFWRLLIDPPEDLQKLLPGHGLQIRRRVLFLQFVEHVGVQDGAEQLQQTDHLGSQMRVIRHVLFPLSVQFFQMQTVSGVGG